MKHTTNAQGVSQVNQTGQLSHSDQKTQANRATQANQSTKDTPANLTDLTALLKQTVPIRCEGVAVVLLKKYL
nr:hypothetical protein [Paenibacillus xylanexedens]